MINFKNIKINFSFFTKGIGISCLAIANAFVPADAFALGANCVNYWIHPNTGEKECFNSQMTVISEPIPLSYNSSSDRYIVGGQQISVPNPDRYVRVTKEMRGVYNLYNSVKDPYNKLLASYIPQSEAEIARRGEIPLLQRGFYLQVLKAAEQESVTPQDFAEIKNTIKAENKKNQAANLSMLQKIVNDSSKNVSQELGVDVAFDVSQIIPLDSHYETDNVFSHSIYLVSEVSAMGEQIEYVMAGTITLVNISGKIVSFYSYGDQADLEWTQKASLAWANKAIANNP